MYCIGNVVILCVYGEQQSISVLYCLKDSFGISFENKMLVAVGSEVVAEDLDECNKFNNIEFEECNPNGNVLSAVILLVIPKGVGSMKYKLVLCLANTGTPRPLRRKRCLDQDACRK